METVIFVTVVLVSTLAQHLRYFGYKPVLRGQPFHSLLMGKTRDDAFSLDQDRAGSAFRFLVCPHKKSH